MANRLLNRARMFLADTQGNIAMTFALLSVPTMMITGVAIYYGAMNSAAVRLQSAVDSAVLAAASQPGNRQTIGTGVFNAAIANAGQTGSAAIIFKEDGKSLSATASLVLQTSVMKLAGVNTVTISRTAKATAGSPGSAGLSDNSCILTGNASGDFNKDTLSLDASSTASLGNCSLHSNASMNCQGAATGATAVTASGVATACVRANSGASPIPDIYAKLASHIETVCGHTDGGAVWQAGEKLPVGDTVVEVARAGYREIHICGELKLKGEISLNGEDSTEDLVIVIENGGVTIREGASISANHVTFVLAGGSGTPAIDPPKSKDKEAKFSISASSSEKNPWRGVAFYQHPELTRDVDMKWKSGARIMIDGLAYFPNANLTISGTLTSGTLGCTKLVAGTMSIEGTIKLSQSAEGCAKLGVRQYSEPGKPAALAYLTQ
jgi:hypothetical protein